LVKQTQNDIYKFGLEYWNDGRVENKIVRFSNLSSIPLFQLSIRQMADKLKVMFAIYQNKNT